MYIKLKALYVFFKYTDTKINDIIQYIMSELLRMTGISKSFGQVKALDNAQLCLKSGEVLALMGENGAGKSTLMNILSGAITNYTGDIFIDGKKTVIASPTAAQKLGIAKIHQELQLVRETSVAENIFMGREKCNRFGFIRKAEMEQEAQKYLDMLELPIKANRKIKSLRIGEQQMVEIAKALSLNARILIMDEPTSAISKTETEHLFAVIKKLVKENVGIIYITHRMEEVFAVADELTIMRDGMYIATLPAAETSRQKIISLMVGREVSEAYPSKNTAIGEKILEVSNLNLRFPHKQGGQSRSLSNIDFTLHKGEILGFAGLLGSGRTELLECLFGLHHANRSGDIIIDGKKTEIRSPGEAIKAGIAFATEDRKGQGLVLLRSIGENMSLAKLKQLSRFSFMNSMREQTEWLEQMDTMRIKASGHKTLCGTLSGGNQQKVVLGRCLMLKPKILLLDEPTRGIDVGAKYEIYVLINKLAAQGIGIILVSSDLPEIMGISDRIITLCEGAVTGEFGRGSATQEQLLYAATLHSKKE